MEVISVDQTSLMLILEACLRELAYCPDRQAVIEYSAMAAGVDKLTLEELLVRLPVVDLYADH